MLTYELLNRTKDRITYLYYPEGREDEDPGKVVFSPDGQVLEIENAPSDKYGGYKVHARGIDINKDKGMIAWY